MLRMYVSKYINTCIMYSIASSQLAVPVASIGLTLVLIRVTITCCLTDNCIIRYATRTSATMSFVPPK